MKKLLLLLPVALLFAACAKKDNAVPKPPLTPEATTDADVMGKWLVKADTLFTVQNGQTTTSEPSHDTEYFTYGADHTATAAESDVRIYLTYYVADGIIKQNTSSSEMDFAIVTIAAGQMLVRENSGSPDAYEDRLLVKQ